MFNTTASITCWTSGTILDTENRSPVWKSNVWQSVRVASRGHLLSLFDDNAQFRFPALVGRSQPEQEKWGHYPLLTPTTPPFPDPSRSWHTHSHSHSPEHTHTHVNGERLTSSDLLSCALFPQIQVWSAPLSFHSDKPLFQMHSNTVKASLRHSECWAAFNNEAHLRSIFATRK